MLLHIGADVGIPLERILFVLNERGMTPLSRAYLERARRERRYVPCAGKAKSYVVLRERGREKVLASHIASSTLEKRWRDEISRAYLSDAAVLSVSDVDG